MIDSMRSWILLLGVFMVLVILTEAVPHKSKKSSSSSDESAKDYNRRLKEKSDSSSEEKKNRALKKDHHHHDKKKKDKKEKDKDEAKGSKNRNGDKKDDSSSSSEEEVHRVGDFDNRKWSPPAYKRSGEPGDEDYKAVRIQVLLPPEPSSEDESPEEKSAGDKSSKE